MRIKPSALAGIGVFFLYVAILIVVGQFSGIPYPELGDTASNLFRGVVPSLVIGGLTIALVANWMGWFGLAMHDQHRVRAWWMLIGPIVVLISIVGNFVSTKWGNVGLAFILAALAMAIAVGFAEEFVLRGMLLVGLRGSMRELFAWALSCIFFGLMHFVNVLLGAPVSGTLSQVVSSALAGSTFYLLRRYFGSLLPAMFLHGLFDMSIFISDHSGGGSILALLDWPAGIISTIAALFVALRTEKDPESYAKGAAAPAPAVA